MSSFRQVRIRRAIVIGLSFAFFCLFFIGDNPKQIKAAPSYYTFVQQDWQQGESVDSASHSLNQTGWSKYFSRDTYIKTLDDTNVEMLPETYSVTDTSDTDFTAGEMDKVVISGTGDQAAVQVTPSVADPFASTLGEWLTLPAQPRPGRFTAFTKAGSVIYCLFASGDGRQFGRWDIAAEKWTMLDPLPAPAAAGAALAWDGEAIFALRGEGSKQVFKYTPGTDTWETFMPLSSGAEYGASIVSVGGTLSSGTGYLYVTLGGAGTSFLYFDPNSGINGMWWGKASTPASVEQGGRLAYPGSGDYIYACRGSHTSSIWRYHIPSNSWDQTVPDMPIPEESTYGQTAEMWRASNMFYPGSGDYIYAAMPYDCFNRNDIRNYQTFWRLGPLSGTPAWERLADCPRYTNETGFILYDPDGTGQEIQLLSGNNYTNPWHYNIAKDQWKELTQPLWISSYCAREIYWLKNHPHTSVVLGTDGFDYKCILDHTSTLQTKPVTGNNWEPYWERLIEYDSVTWADATIYPEGAIVQGTDGNDYRCIRYHLSTSDSQPITGVDYNIYWSTPAVTTRGEAWATSTDYKVGPYDDYLYWHNRNNNNFWRYKISTNSWERLANLPWTTSGRTGGGRFADIGDGYLYSVRAGRCTRVDFARYDLVNDLWETLRAVPNDYYRIFGRGPNLVGAISKADRVMGTDGFGYRCIKSHTANAAVNKPITGSEWDKYWESNGTTDDCVTWADGTDYASGLECIKPSIVVGNDGVTDIGDYKCIKNHKAATNNQPITGADWATYWQDNLTIGEGEAWAVDTRYNAFEGTPGHYRFLFIGQNCQQRYYYRYDPLVDNWTTVFGIQSWNAYTAKATWTGLDAPDKGKYIYRERGRGNTNFMRYDIEMDYWETLSNSIIGQRGANITNDGVSPYLYSLYGCYHDNRWYKWQRYNVNNGSWEELDPLPFDTRVAAICATPDALFSTNYYGYSNFFKYDLHRPTHNQPGIWSKPVKDLSYTSYANGKMVTDNQGYIYLIFGDATQYLSSNIWVFDTNATQSKIIGSDFKDYECTLSHTSTLDSYPVTGANWTDYWQASRSTGEGETWLAGEEYYCSKHANRWAKLIRAPFLLGEGVNAEFLSDQNSIYVLEGKGSKRFWRYEVDNDRWLPCAESLSRIYRGSEFAGGCNIEFSGQPSPMDLIFCQGGWNQRQFDVYFAEFDQWATYAESPDGHNYRGTNSMTYCSYNNKVYKLRTEVTDTVYEYYPATDVWGSISPVGTGGEAGKTYTCDHSSVIHYPGSGKYLYCLTGSNKQQLLHYNMDTESWNERVKPPTTISNYGGSMASVGNNYVYIFDTTQNDYLYRFHKDENAYDIPAYLPVSLDEGGVICGYKGNIYYLCGDSGQFYRFNIGTSLWGGLNAAPSTMPNEDPCMKAVEYEGSVDIYTTGGRSRSEWLKYSVAEDVWSELEQPLYSWGWGNGFQQVGDYIYCMRGSSSMFWRYNIKTEEWGDLADVPAYVGRGAAITYPGKGDYLYALVGNRSPYFYRYSISNNVWNVLSPCMVKILDSHSELIYPGFGNFLYILHGSSWNSDFESYTYMRYDILEDEWEELAPASFGVDHPGSMIWPGGEYYYATKGYGRYELSMYYAFCYGSYESGIKAIGAHSGWGNVNWTFNDTQAAELSFRSGNESDLSDALSWDLCGSMEQGADLSTASSVNETDNYVQYKIGFSTDNLLELPTIDDVTIEYESYPLSQEIISSPYDTTFPQNRLFKLEWSDSQALGTDIRFKLRTASDLAGLAAAAWSGPADATVETFDFSQKPDYVANSQIEFNAGTVKLFKRLADFNYSQTLYIDNGGGPAKTDFLITIQIPLVSDDFWDNIKSDCADIRFHDGTQELEYYLASFDYDTHEAKINVQIPSIGADSTKLIYMVYGSGDAESESNPSHVNVPTDGIVGYWKFDDGAGDMVTDSSGYANTGTRFPTAQKGSPAWVEDGKYGSAMYFDGIDDYVRVYNVPDLGQEYTIAFWGTIDEEPTEQRSWQTAISCQWGYPNIWLNPNNWMYHYWHDPKGSSHGNNFSYHTRRDEKWRHYVISHDSEGYKGYTDAGIYRNYKSFTYLSRDIPTMAWDIGRHYNSSYRWRGHLDEVVLYNRALSSLEVKYLYEGMSTDWTYKITFASKEEAATCASLVSSGWEKKIPLEVESTVGLKLDDLVRIDLGKWYDFWAHVKSDGADIRVVDSDDTTVLDYYIPEWDYADKQGFILVKVPSLPLGTKTLYLYYGNSLAVSAEDPSFCMNVEEDFSDYGQVAGDSAALSAWSYKIPLMLKNNSGSDFGTVDDPDPAMVRVDMEESWDTFWANVNADGSDLRVVASDNETVLTYWLDFFDSDLKQGSVIVEVPAINNGEDQVYWLYFGNPGAVSASTGAFLIPLQQATGVPTEVSRAGESFNPDWLYKTAITVNKISDIEIPVGGTVYRYVNIQIPPEWIDFWLHVKADGGDIRFYDEDVVSGNPINEYFDTDYFDYTKQKASIDLRIQIDEATTWPKVIHLYYGNEWGYTASSNNYNAFDLATYGGLDETKLTAGGGARQEKSAVLNQG
jgi:hypothetical protein